MHITGVKHFVDELTASRSAAAAESLKARAIAAGTEVARELFGVGAPFEVSLSGPYLEIALHQTLTVRDQVSDPRTEIALEDACRFADDVSDGDEIGIPIQYTHAAHEAEWRAGLADVAPRLPLPLHHAELWDRLNRRLNDLLLAEFPAPGFEPGTAGALLSAGGGWLQGLSVEMSGTRLTIEATRLTYWRIHPARGYIDVEIDVQVHTAAGSEPWRLDMSGHSAEIEAWARGPASERARGRVIEHLAQLAATTAEVGTGRQSGFTACKALLDSLLDPPEPGSFAAWCRDRLAGLLVGRTFPVAVDGAPPLTVIVTAVEGPHLGLLHFGATGVGFAWHDAEGVLVREDGQTLGGLDFACLHNNPAQPLPEQAFGPAVATWVDWLQAQLVHHVAANGPPTADVHDPFYLYGFASAFPLVEVLGKWSIEGPPRAPLVPLATSAGGAGITATTGERRVRVEALLGQRHPLALIDCAGHTIVLADDLSKHPFGDAFIGLVPPAGDAVCEVMRCDVWNPPTRATVDGDAHAFAVFCAWLRDRLGAAGLDAVIAFDPVEEEGDDEEYDDADDEAFDAEDADGEGASMTLRDWLKFGQVDGAERFVIDWRHQWHVVQNGADIVDCFAGIYGMSPEQTRTLRQRDRAEWRTFLREVIDPRFA